jgi:hypothetical protein
VWSRCVIKCVMNGDSTTDSRRSALPREPDFAGQRL